jgi:hypothetical protein
MFRSGTARPAHARSSGSETFLRILSLAAYIIGTLESRFRTTRGSVFIRNCIAPIQESAFRYAARRHGPPEVEPRLRERRVFERWKRRR